MGKGAHLAPRARGLAPSAARTAAPHIEEPASPVRVPIAAVVGALVAAALVAALVAWVAGFGPGPALGVAALSGLVGGAVACAVVLGAYALASRRAREGERARLLDAASPVHPLMRRLMAEAPGTYAHAMAVASLAEQGAEAIGADALIARVGAYYHDVGKIRRPEYFFENQPLGENPHDDADPSMSAVIITAHVADGVELADEYRLPPRVREIVAEHHGTSLVRYFYQKAAEQDPQVYESHFRYQGLLPRTREAGVVMLADSSEAAVRAMRSPSVERVAEAVRTVFADRVKDGQLADSGLDAADVETLVGTFSRALVGHLHARCAYPRTEP